MLVTFRFRRGGIQHGGLAGTREMHYITWTTCMTTTWISKVDCWGKLCSTMFTSCRQGDLVKTNPLIQPEKPEQTAWDCSAGMCANKGCDYGGGHPLYHAVALCLQGHVVHRTIRTKMVSQMLLRSGKPCWRSQMEKITVFTRQDRPPNFWAKWCTDDCALCWTENIRESWAWNMHWAWYKHCLFRNYDREMFGMGVDVWKASMDLRNTADKIEFIFFLSFACTKCSRCVHWSACTLFCAVELRLF